MSSIAYWTITRTTATSSIKHPTAYDHNRTKDNQYGLDWAEPIQNINGDTQQSAVDLLVAAQPVNDAPETAAGSS